ncbi:MAG TPA: hypothetical protein VGG64_04040 [Pirellulales bacterium]|jgi:hypothetical protein
MREEQPTRRRLFQLGLLLVIAATGCGWTAPRPGSDDQLHAHEHDPDEVPSTEADVAMPANYAEAVKRVREYATTIKVAIVAETPSKAHRPLDELDIVIGKLMPIVKDSNVPRTDWEESTSPVVTYGNTSTSSTPQ